MCRSWRKVLRWSTDALPGRAEGGGHCSLLAVQRAPWATADPQRSQRRQATEACAPLPQRMQPPCVPQGDPRAISVVQSRGTSRLWGTPRSVRPKASLQTEGPLVRRGGAVKLTTARLAKLQVLWRSCARSERQQ